MTIKILMKRQVPEDKFKALKELIDQLRSATTGQPGYISGETLRRVDQYGECLVISKWKSRADWERWYERPERAIIQQKIDDLLGSSTVYEIYEYD
ncbi:MAG: antibiotic biosynthesis monooxygenase family protein [Pseudomonadota bacterium]|uniref:Antibiotic biosynthesis monooxygenase n=1 Tax=Candidatus Desulfatibia profunda TaxID=2841695 RepID=A0A8J6TP81_9BACT|nr:antibiotic biosynthesis monooxygenase [Candidatus Desulfatibia profunda]MBL7180923.1 antibiotic biosynthesis monooxygenase [Desulfobacterales bacterium]MBU0699396.1 antibiotic biosynthesis monooxygenase [Pseudomonadota bacterium]